MYFLQFSHLFASNPLKLQKGALLYGMPGTGKTLLAVELAKSSGMNLIHIKGPELLNKFIGASEEAVRNLFHKYKSMQINFQFIKFLLFKGFGSKTMHFIF